MPEYEPFDQDRWLTKPWTHDHPQVIAWEQAHGHDVRLKCYVEFGCMVIEPTLERKIARLENVLREIATGTEAWTRRQMIELAANAILEGDNDGR